MRKKMLFLFLVITTMTGGTISVEAQYSSEKFTEKVWEMQSLDANGQTIISFRKEDGNNVSFIQYTVRDFFRNKQWFTILNYSFRKFKKDLKEDPVTETIWISDYENSVLVINKDTIEERSEEHPYQIDPQKMASKRKEAIFLLRKQFSQLYDAWYTDKTGADLNVYHWRNKEKFLLLESFITGLE
jgi:hypothetical protein